MKRIFIDMDGTIAEYRKYLCDEQYLLKGYYISLRPFASVIGGLKMVKERHPEIEMCIISAYPAESEYAQAEKDKWLNKYCPFIDRKVFVYIGDNKAEIIGRLTKNDFLLDDYKKNLFEWQAAGGTPIRVLNGLNQNSDGISSISTEQSSESIADTIETILNGRLSITNRKTVQLRNEKTGQTLEMQKSDLERIVETLPYRSLSEFRNKYTPDDFDYILAVGKCKSWSNTTYAQFKCELHKLKKEIERHDKEMIVEFFKKFEKFENAEIKKAREKCAEYLK